MCNNTESGVSVWLQYTIPAINSVQYGPQFRIESEFGDSVNPNEFFFSNLTFTSSRRLFIDMLRE